MKFQDTVSPIRFRLLLGDFEYFYKRFLPAGLLVGALTLSMALAYILVNISAPLALLGILAIPIGILLIMQPRYGVLLIVFLIPFENFNEFGGGLSVLKLLSVVVFGAAAAHFLIFRSRDSLVGSRQNWLIGLLVIVVILSNFVAVAPSRTLESTAKLLRILSLYFIVINVILDEAAFKQLIWVFLVSGFISALYGLYAYYIDNSLLNSHHAVNRMIGTMGDPNEFTGAMVVRLSLAIGLITTVTKRSTQLFLMMMIGVMAYSITLTGSRGGLIGAGIALGFFVLLQKNKIIWLVLISALVGLSLIFMPLQLKERVGLVESSSANLGNSTNRRESYQIFGWELIQQNPFFGIGMDGFGEAYSHSEYRFLQTERTKRVAHNTYLEIAAGTGFVGLAVFLSLLGTSLYMAWKYAKYRESHPFPGSVSGGLFAGQGGYFLIALFLSQQYEKTLWLLIAMVVVAQNLINVAERKRTSKNQRRAMLPPYSTNPVPREP